MSKSERKKTIRRVVIFSLAVNGLAFLAPLLGGSPAAPGPGFILWGTAPLLVSVVMRAAERDWTDFGARPAIRKSPGWYLASLVALPALMLLALLIGILLSPASITEFSAGKFLQTFLTALPIFLIFAIFEEVGWRGYLSPKLDALGLNRLAASALTAVVWATWHLPYIRELSWVYSAEDPAVFIPRFYLVCFAFSILFGELRSLTGSFWAAVLIHAVGNAFGHPLAAEYVRIAPGMEYLASISNGLFFIALVFLLGVAINRWRLRRATGSG